MGYKMKSLILIMGCLFFTQGVKGQTANDQEILMAGDAVRIQIWDLLEDTQSKGIISNLGGDYVINTDGDILMPFIGLLRVAGRTPSNVETLIKTKYGDFLTSEPFIYVRPLIRVTVAGNIARPGSYRIDPKSSLWDLFDLTGGPTSEADLRKIYVVRGGKRVIKNLLTAFEKAHSLSEVGIQSGDQIGVPRIKNFSFQVFINYLNLGLTIVWLYLRTTDRW